MNNFFLYIRSGVINIIHHPLKFLLVAAYILIVLYLWNSFAYVFDTTDKNILFTIAYKSIEIFIVFAAIKGFFVLLAIIGKPFCSFFIQYHINNIGLTNCKKQSPILVSRRKDKNKQYGVIYTFANMDIPIEDFEKKSSALGQTLKSKIRYFELAKNSAYTLVYATPLKHNKPIEISSNNDFLTKDLINLLVVGNTGSGKSIAMGVILQSLIRKYPNISVTICDYKKSSFAQYADTANFYGYDDVPNGIQEFYKEFQSRLEANDVKRNSQKRVLLIDEYGALISARDKKQAEKLKSMIAEMLFMARSLGLIIIIGIQRADAEYFNSGAREQFRAILALGNLSPQQKQMIANDYKDKMTANNPIGYGYLLVDGKDIERVRIVLADETEQAEIIRSAMNH